MFHCLWANVYQTYLSARQVEESSGFLMEKFETMLQPDTHLGVSLHSNKQQISGTLLFNFTITDVGLAFKLCELTFDPEVRLD